VASGVRAGRLGADCSDRDSLDAARAPDWGDSGRDAPGVWGIGFLLGAESEEGEDFLEQGGFGSVFAWALLALLALEALRVVGAVLVRAASAGAAAASRLVVLRVHGLRWLPKAVGGPQKGPAHSHGPQSGPRLCQMHSVLPELAFWGAAVCCPTGTGRARSFPSGPLSPASPPFNTGFQGASGNGNRSFPPKTTYFEFSGPGQLREKTQAPFRLLRRTT
jgi:hypothetical protein